MKSQLLVKPINDLLGEKFYVPSYQRGYRWTPIQVKELLNDIWDFHRKDNKTKEEFYCLQPIVVTPHNGEWELIDGQQRLTTIYLILLYLKTFLLSLRKDSYSIRYQTRTESEAFLQNIDLTKENNNIDYYHFCNAYKTIDEWFKSKDGAVQFHFLATLTNDDEAGRNVKVIWYEVGKEVNAIDIFTRINIGKIPLNNAELVRALFLRQGNFEKGGDKRISLKQMQIGSEWDIIENTLQQDAFWYFIYQGNKEYATRIEYIFDLMKGKNDEHEDYHTFHKFNEQFEQVKNIDKIWLEIKHFFQTFKDWFSNNDLYHLVGFLIATGSSILELKTKSEGLSKAEFNIFLTAEIRKKVRFQIADVEYKDKFRVKSVLLLFNIQTIVKNKNSNIRFPFDSYKNDTWHIEHIRSVKSDKPRLNKQKEWLENVLEYFIGKREIDRDQIDKLDTLNVVEKRLCQNIILLLEKKFSDDEFSSLYIELLLHFGEEKEPEDINTISNLALLDATTNVSYKNAVFPIKRKIILRNDAEGTFVPICTKNVFLKTYTNKVDNVMFWQEHDAENYLKAIQETLSIYLPAQNQNNGNAN